MDDWNESTKAYFLWLGFIYALELPAILGWVWDCTQNYVCLASSPFLLYFPHSFSDFSLITHLHLSPWFHIWFWDNLMKASSLKTSSVIASLGKMFLKSERRFIAGIWRKSLDLSRKNPFHTFIMGLLQTFRTPILYCRNWSCSRIKSPFLSTVFPHMQSTIKSYQFFL